MIDFDSLTKGLNPQDVKDCINKTTIDYFGGIAKMATHTGKQSILDEALGHYKDYGFSLVESEDGRFDDHFLELWFKGKRIAIYNQTKATFDVIKQGCQNFLVNKLAQDHNDCYGEELKHSG